MYIPIQDTIVCEQANRRPDVIQQIVYEDEEQVADDVVRKLDQLGFARPLTSEKMC